LFPGHWLFTEIMDRLQEILAYWFEGATDETPIDRNAFPFKKWFAKSPAIDSEIRKKFEVDLRRAEQGEYKSWELSPEGRLALILLFDQFSRNMYRDTPKMFATDPLALALSLSSITEALDRQLSLIEREFFYMPLMHSEQLEIQKLSLKCFQDLIAESRIKNQRNTAYYEYTGGFAQRHHDTIARFGRFPHRNIILNRPSTMEELEFLKGE